MTDPGLCLPGGMLLKLQLQRLSTRSEDEGSIAIVERSITTVYRRMAVGADQHHIVQRVRATPAEPLYMVSMTQLRTVFLKRIPQTYLALPGVHFPQF